MAEQEGNDAGGICRISGRLYMSGLQGATDQNQLRGHQIKQVVNLSGISTHLAPEFSCLELELEEDKNITKVFDQAIAAFAREEGRTLVHCKMGVSRSAAVVLAILLHEEGYTLKAAWEHLKSQRPYSEPSTALWQQLSQLERRCYGLELSTMSLRDYIEGDMREEFGASLDTTLWHRAFAETMSARGVGFPEKLDFYFAYRNMLSDSDSGEEGVHCKDEESEPCEDTEEATSGEGHCHELASLAKRPRLA